MIPKECWKDIYQYENIYQISNFGRVKRLDRYLFDCNGNKYHYKEKILKPQKRNGYLRISLTINYNSKTYSVHRLVAQAFIPNLDNKGEVNHINGKKQDNNVWNLEWVTPSENDKHAYKNGLISRKGEKNSRAKLTKNDVILIRKLKKKYKIKGTTLATLFNISLGHVCNITGGHSWNE